MIFGGERSRFIGSIAFANAVVVAAALIIIFGARTWAQQGEGDVGEAGISTGIAFGGTGTNVALAGAVGTSMDRDLILMVEGRYVPMGDKTFITYPGVVAHSSGLYHFSIPIQIRVPLRSKWEPYGIIAPVFIYSHYRRQGIHPGGSTYYFGASDVRGGAEAGGGVRYYPEEHWGFKGEYSYTITSRNFSSLLASVFRQF